MKIKTLIVVDMQNDFIDGSLASDDAKAIVGGITELVKGWDGQIVFTMDTHLKNEYLDSHEGKRLPIEHCILGESGRWINCDIATASVGKKASFVEKHGFALVGSEWHHEFIDWDDREFFIVGTRTDICVVSNALTLRAEFPEADITVISNLCSGTSKEAHEAALTVMRSCHIDVT